MSSIFTKIINGDIPCYKIAENDDFFAFLDIFPLQKGHTLIVPKKEIDYIFDLDDHTLKNMMLFAKKVGKAIEKKIKCERIGLSVIGLEVPHAHIHLIPINGINDMNFSKEKLKLTPEEFKEIAEGIHREFVSL